MIIRAIGAVHPHACGEHCIMLFIEYICAGSSPRMWGTHLIQFHPQRFGRFIPTHVGNTFSSPAMSQSFTVHPHACGEHIKRLGIIVVVGGSSPRMWGTHYNNAIYPIRQRFIPTHVGNTLPPHTASVEGSVHPHACGEHLRTPYQRRK